MKVEDRTWCVPVRHGEKTNAVQNQIAWVFIFLRDHDSRRGPLDGRFYSWLESIRMERASGDFSLKAHLEELNLRQIIANLNVYLKLI